MVLKKLIVLLSVLFIGILSPQAQAVFGQKGVPLIEYYEHGKTQTGVCFVFRQKVYHQYSSVTANLIDTGLPALKGRILISCGHTLCNYPDKDWRALFVTSEGRNYYHDIKKIYYAENDLDLSLILLSSPVNTDFFKPLKMNFSLDPKTLNGQNIDIFGCSLYFGSLDKRIRLRGTYDNLKHQGISTVLHYYNNISLLKTYCYPSEGCVMIDRNPLSCEEKNLDPLVLPFNRQLEEALVFHENVNLNFQEVHDAWEAYLSESNSPARKDLTLGEYRIRLFKPLPRLSGQVYRGDSGGAWVSENQIFGITVGTYRSGIAFQEAPLYDKALSTKNNKEYFDYCEELLASISEPLTNDRVTATVGYPLIYFKDWIEKILAKLEKNFLGGVTIRGKTLEGKDFTKKFRLNDTLEEEFDSFIHEKTLTLSKEDFRVLTVKTRIFRGDESETLWESSLGDYQLTFKNYYDPEEEHDEGES